MIQTIDECQLGASSTVCRLLDCSKVSLWRFMKDPAFPRPLRALPGNSRSKLRFRISEIHDWIERRQALSIAAAEAGRLDARLGK